MSRQRFRNLEMGAQAPKPAPDDADEPRSGPRRALEMERGLELDTSGVVRTDFCRRCRAENPEGASECHACGAGLGGPDQEAFDAEMRAERARRRAEHGDARGEAQLPPALRGAPPLPDLGTLQRDGESALEPPRGVPDVEPPPSHPDEPGFGAVIATGALAAAIFALVSMPVRLVFAASAGQTVPGRAFVEILLCAGLTVAVWWRFRRTLRKL